MSLEKGLCLGVSGAVRPRTQASSSCVNAPSSWMVRGSSVCLCLLNVEAFENS